MSAKPSLSPGLATFGPRSPSQRGLRSQAKERTARAGQVSQLILVQADPQVARSIRCDRNRQAHPQHSPIRLNKLIKHKGLGYKKVPAHFSLWPSRHRPISPSQASTPPDRQTAMKLGTSKTRPRYPPIPNSKTDFQYQT